MDNIYKSGIDAIDELTIKIHDPSISKIYRDELAELRDFRIRDIFKYDNNSSWYEPKLWRLVFEKLDGLKLPTIFWGEYYNSLPNNWSLELLRFTHLSLDYDGFIIYLKKDNKIYFKNSESYYTSSLFDQYNHLLPNTKGGEYLPNKILMTKSLYYLYSMSGNLRNDDIELFHRIVGMKDRKCSRSYDNKTEQQEIISNIWGREIEQLIFKF